MKQQTNYDYVDLDLPSGTLWATCNIGADKPWKYGKYFQWGDTEGYYDNEEHDFSWDTYKWCDGNYDTLNKYNYNSRYGSVDNKLILEPEDDAAHIHMDGDWRMPTKEEMLELIDNTNNKWVENYQGTGINGRLYTSKKDSSKSIFIPASGRRWGSSVRYQGTYSELWGSVLYTGYPYDTCVLYFHSDGCIISHNRRYYGYCVRGVKN